MDQTVLVVGAGPVGLTMAAELARYGIAARIIDKAEARTDKSKALVLWSRSLELIDRMGCGAGFVAAGLKVTAAAIWAGGHEIARVDLGTVQTPHPYALMLPQSETERLMEQHLGTFGVTVERAVELLRFAPVTDGVGATLLHADGREETVRPAWLIGCDGAHSTVRRGLGMEFDGDTMPSDWVLADVHLAGVRSRPDELAMFWHADGVLALFPIAPGRYRVLADVGDAQDGARRPDPTLAKVQALLDGRGPGGITASAPVWLAAFRINERKVADYRAGRVFLAGDAAHIHSPAGGQGMNTGMQDACNLGWKLALACRGAADPGPLLDSYSIERSAVGRAVLANAGRLTRIAMLRGGAAQAVRNHVAALVFGLSAVRQAVADTLTELSIGYPESPLTGRGPHLHAGPAAGERAPVRAGDRPVGAGPAPRFALFAASDAASGRLIARYPGLMEPEPRAPFAEGGAWLVRPDGYVGLAVRGDALGAVGDYLDRVAAGGGTDAAAAPLR